MKTILAFFFAILFVSLLTSCKKENNTQQPYRVATVTSYYYSLDEYYQTHVTYENNRIKSTVAENEAKIENTYAGDSVVSNYFYYRENNWSLNSRTIEKFQGNLVQEANVFLSEDPGSLYRKVVYTYEGEKPLEINGFTAEEDSLVIYDSFRYFYNADQLMKASFYFRALTGEDIVENFRREFTYQNNLLDEEFVYTDYYGYPIQLTYKKHYSYDDKNRLLKAEYFNYQGGDFLLDAEEVFSYDDADNQVKRVKTNVAGTILFEEEFTYEVGLNEYQSIYDVLAGEALKHPLPISAAGK
jgi:hypothetical protein